MHSKCDRLHPLHFSDARHAVGWRPAELTGSCGCRMLLQVDVGHRGPADGQTGCRMLLQGDVGHRGPHLRGPAEGHRLGPAPVVVPGAAGGLQDRGAGTRAGLPGGHRRADGQPARETDTNWLPFMMRHGDAFGKHVPQGKSLLQLDRGEGPKSAPRDTDRQMGRQTDRQTDRQTSLHSDRGKDPKSVPRDVHRSIAWLSWWRASRQRCIVQPSSVCLPALSGLICLSACALRQPWWHAS
jgi:hypothetical protein